MEAKYVLVDVTKEVTGFALCFVVGVVENGGDAENSSFHSRHASPPNHSHHHSVTAGDISNHNIFCVPRQDKHTFR